MRKIKILLHHYKSIFLIKTYSFLFNIYSILFHKKFLSMIRIFEENSDFVEVSKMKMNYKFSDEILTKDRFIVSANINNIYSGLGCLLSILAPAWSYALATKRTLVIDWRKNPYTSRDPDNNLFSNLFETGNLSKDLGISVIADQSVSELILPKSFLRDKNNNSPVERLCSRYYRSILHREIDVPTETLLPSLRVTFPIRRLIKNNQNVNLRKLFQALHPRAFIQKDIDYYYKKYMLGKKVIGVHVRHGNGEEKKTEHFKSRVIKEFKTFIAKLIESIENQGISKFNGSYSVFLCTDSDLVSKALIEKFPELLLSPSWKPPIDAGIDFDNSYSHPDGPVAVAASALVDMYLLAKCNSVLVARKTEFVSMVPYIMESSDS